MERLLTLYSEVQSTDVRWLWYPFIAIGKITLLQGDPGDGKSTMMMNLIAELSTGGKTPDGCKIGAPQKVIYQCSEDGVSDTIKPRLERYGADCRKIAFINEEVYNGLTLDDERIRQAIIEFRPRLVVIDPIQAYLGSDSDLQIAGRARKLMRRLGMWAAGYDCAIVLIGHLNKKEGSKGLYRSLGSIDVVAAARSVLQVERDTENPDIRIVHQIKNSLAPTAEDIRFSISADKGFRWLECRPQSFENQKPDRKKKPMSELAAPLKIYPQVLENVRVTDKKAAQNDPAVQEAVSKVAEALGDTGRILVRESGTEPVVRVMVEAPDHDTCQKYVDEVVNGGRSRAQDSG